MKIFKTMLLVITILCVPIFVVACKNKDMTGNNNSQILVDYQDLKVLATAATPSSWSNISATRLDEDGEEKIIINKLERQIVSASKFISAKNNQKLNFIIENDEEKVYCKDNVRYHKGKTRNYIDESDFDSEKFIEEIISEYLDEIYDFFEEDDKSKLLSSNKKENGNKTTYEFEAKLNEKDNTKIKVEVITKNSYVIVIKFKITGGKNITVELKETDEIVATPDWFDNNDYKTTMTYDEVKEIATNESLFSDWNFAQLNLPVGYSECQEVEVVYAEKSGNKSYRETLTTKNYYDGLNLFKYANGVAVNKTVPDEEELKKYDFTQIVNDYKTFTYQMFFIYEEEYIQYYEAAKKYKKDITVVSYKFTGTSGPVEFEAICLLYFDLDDNLYQISCYMEQHNADDPTNSAYKMEINDLTIKKAENFSVPTWFDENDFE